MGEFRATPPPGIIKLRRRTLAAAFAAGAAANARAVAAHAPARARQQQAATGVTAADKKAQREARHLAEYYSLPRRRTLDEILRNNGLYADAVARREKKEAKRIAAETGQHWSA